MGAGVDLRASALLSFIPWLVMALGSSAAGLLADGLVRSGVSVTTVRKGVQVRLGAGTSLWPRHCLNPACCGRALRPSCGMLCSTLAMNCC